MSMGLSLLQATQEEVDHSEQVSRLKGELRDVQDDLELKETLLKSSKENVGLLEGQLVAFKEEVEKRIRCWLSEMSYMRPRRRRRSLMPPS
jgi:5-methylcytosine-specific restriction endonuclease McrBC GTP-binding regulatory subunit McrB